MDFQQLLVRKQSTAGICGLARLGSKFGLRCVTDRVAEVYAAVKPD